MPDLPPLSCGMSNVLVRAGLVSAAGRMAFGMEARGLPVLVSANSLFDHKRGIFRKIPDALTDLDWALDSAGFVAMARYGKFPWSVAQYVDLALLSGCTWWAQMDCCCEPEIAADRDVVRARVKATSQLLSMCRNTYIDATDANRYLRDFTPEPMPVLQGWLPEDYRESAELANWVLNGKWPDLVGLGSVCRRHLGGEAGLWRVLAAVDHVLPPHVRIHAFGVKGNALARLAEHPRIFSTDSCAFEFRARVVSREAGISKSIDLRLGVLDQWMSKQVPAGTEQLQLGV